MFLSEKELYDLSKKKQRKKQYQYLLENQIPYLVDGNGFPKVSKAALEQRLGLKSSGRARTPTQPNFDAFKSIRDRNHGKTAEKR